MAAKKRSRINPIPLLPEPHPDEYTGYPFITLLQYQHDAVLTIVDDSDDKRIQSFVLDLCGPMGVDEELLLSVAQEWWEHSAEKYPLSVELSRRGLTAQISAVHRSYNIEFITRVIGPLQKFNMSKAPTIKRRRRKPVSPNMDVRRVSTAD